MKEKDKIKNAKVFLRSSIVDIVLCIVAVIVAAGMKDSYRYYFDVDLRSTVEMLNTVAIFLGVSGVVGVVACSWVLAKSNAAKKDDENSNLFNCPDCQHQISVNAVNCPYCGWMNKAIHVRKAAKNDSDKNNDVCSDATNSGLKAEEG